MPKFDVIIGEWSQDCPLGFFEIKVKGQSKLMTLIQNASKEGTHAFNSSQAKKASYKQNTLSTCCYADVEVAVDLYLGKLIIVLSDSVERRLRFAAVLRLGGKKGNLSRAVEEAIEDWLKKESLSNEHDPVDRNILPFSGV